MAEGILSTKEAQEQKAMELLGDTEYTLPFYMKLENNPLFKVGFDPQKIYYQREGYQGKTNNPGSYYSDAFNKEIIQKNLDRAIERKDTLRSERLQEILKNIEDPSDFVFMEGAGKELTDKNKSTVVHEFVHRSLYENPELVKFLEHAIDHAKEELKKSKNMLEYINQDIIEEPQEAPRNEVAEAYLDSSR